MGTVGLQYLITWGSPEAPRLNDAEFGTKQDSHQFSPLLFVALKVWFKNRRAKFRKKQRSLQKEQLQKQKDCEGSHSEGKTEPPVLETQATTPDTEKVQSLPSEAGTDLNLTLSEQSASESAPEDQTDREEEFKSTLDEAKVDKSPGVDSKALNCKRASPKAGEGQHLDGGWCQDLAFPRGMLVVGCSPLFPVAWVLADRLSRLVFLSPALNRTHREHDVYCSRRTETVNIFCSG